MRGVSYDCGRSLPETVPVLTAAEYEVAKSILRQAGFHVHDDVWVIGYTDTDPTILNQMIIRIPGLPFYISKPHTEFPRDIVRTQPQASTTPKQNNPPNATKNDQGNKDQENNNGESDPGAVGTAAVALLKSIDESKEKAAEVFQKTCDYLVTKGGIARVAHAFRSGCEHNFGPLFARMGVDINSATEEGKKRIIEVGTKILMDISQKLIQMGSKLNVDADGLFYNIVVEYGGEFITVRGCIHDGIIKTGTLFIHSQHVR